MTAAARETRAPDVIGAVLHPTDLTQEGVAAFAHALRLGLSARARLTLLHVGRVERTHWLDFPGIRDTLARWGELPRDARRRDVVELGLRAHKLKLEAGSPVRGILARARRGRADLIVLATHRRAGLVRWLRPSIAEATARSASCPTLILPWRSAGFVDARTGDVRLQRVLVPVTRTPGPGPALAALESLLHSLDLPEVEVRLLHVGDHPESVPRPSRLAEPGWRAVPVDRSGGLVETITDEAQHCDLVVMGTRGHDSVLDQVLGSRTERVLHRVDCPVLVVPEP